MLEYSTFCIMFSMIRRNLKISNYTMYIWVEFWGHRKQVYLNTFMGIMYFKSILVTFLNSFWDLWSHVAVCRFCWVLECEVQQVPAVWTLPIFKISVPILLLKWKVFPPFYSESTLIWPLVATRSACMTKKHFVLVCWVIDLYFPALSAVPYLGQE